MNIYIYSDESGVFDRVHNDVFVFGGLIFLSKEEKDRCANHYLAAERVIREASGIQSELKATVLTNEQKGKLVRSLNCFHKFAACIDQKRINENIWENKKSKQRYLDFAYKIAIRRAFEGLIREGKIDPSDVSNIGFWVDEHATATNGRYELREAIEQELIIGTFNMNWQIYYPPVFRCRPSLTLEYCNSAHKTLVRAADLISNRIYHLAINDPGKIAMLPNSYATRLP